MIELRPFNKLGSADHGWLKARHHFSFGSHYDPGNLGHGSLRVWNDDEIAPNTGFPAHPHANMEIITYVREGAITHQDSLGDKDALPIRAEARVLATTLKAGDSAEYAAGKTRNLYLVPAAGVVEINGVRVKARDGAAIRDEAHLKITALEDSELVLVDAA